MPQSLAYEEPDLIQLLVIGSFIYALNVVRIASDHLLYAGIVTEIACGIIYGSPLAGLLPTSWESTFTTLGYLGLILVVFEGGLSTNLPVLLSNLPLSTICALTGIGLPIAFSLALLNGGFGYRPLEAFAAGAALSSTSLGTTLVALNSATKSLGTSDKMSSSHTTESNRPSLDTPIPLANIAVASEDRNASASILSHQPSLQHSRIGTVLVSAAIIDDVIGLVIASLIPALASVGSSPSGGGQGNLAWTIIRPLLSSALIAVVGCLVARFLLRPLFWYRGMGERWCAPARGDKTWGGFVLARGDGWGTEAHADAVKLFLMVSSVSAMAAITTYTGTSVLYGAYVSGLILTYISTPPETSSGSSEDPSAVEEFKFRDHELSFEGSFARTIGPLQNYFLLPLFFASIGFAIPFLDLWQPTVLWRGIVYAVLMCLAKLAVGLPILLYTATIQILVTLLTRTKRLLSSLYSRCVAFLTVSLRLRRGRETAPSRREVLLNTAAPQASGSHEHDDKPREVRPMPAATTRRSCQEPGGRSSSRHQTVTSIPSAVFMGVAMVSRGEIGLLIAQLAHTGQQDESAPSGITGLLDDEAFLVAIWAILLCTLVGPVGVGVVVRRWGSKVTAGIWA